MFQIPSGLRLAAGFQADPLRRFAAAACNSLRATLRTALCTALRTSSCITLCTTFAVLVVPAAASAQAQAPAQAQAQAPAPQARPANDLRPDPLNAQASVPPLLHESAFTKYRRLTDVPVGSWRDANDTVTRIGGWRVYAREAAGPASPASPPASPASPTAAPPASTPSAPVLKPAAPAKDLPMPAGRHPHAGHKMN